MEINFDLPPIFDIYDDEDFNFKFLSTLGVYRDSAVDVEQGLIFNDYNDDVDVYPEDDNRFVGFSFLVDAHEKADYLIKPPVDFEPNLKDTLEFDASSTQGLLLVHKTHRFMQVTVVGELKVSTLQELVWPNKAHNMFDQMLQQSSLSSWGLTHSFDPGSLIHADKWIQQHLGGETKNTHKVFDQVLHSIFVAFASFPHVGKGFGKQLTEDDVPEFPTIEKGIHLVVHFDHSPIFNFYLEAAAKPIFLLIYDVIAVNGENDHNKQVDPGPFWRTLWLFDEMPNLQVKLASPVLPFLLDDVSDLLSMQSVGIRTLYMLDGVENEAYTAFKVFDTGSKQEIVQKDFMGTTFAPDDVGGDLNDPMEKLLKYGVKYIEGLLRRQTILHLFVGVPRHNPLNELANNVLNQNDYPGHVRRASLISTNRMASFLEPKSATSLDRVRKLSSESDASSLRNNDLSHYGHSFIRNEFVDGSLLDLPSSTQVSSSTYIPGRVVLHFCGYSQPVLPAEQGLLDVRNRFLQLQWDMAGLGPKSWDTFFCKITRFPVAGSNADALKLLFMVNYINATLDDEKFEDINPTVLPRFVFEARTVLISIAPCSAVLSAKKLSKHTWKSFIRYNNFAMLTGLLTTAMLLDGVHLFLLAIA